MNKNLQWIRALHRDPFTHKERSYRPAVVIQAARQGTRQDVLDIVMDRQMMAERGLEVGDRISFGIDPDDRTALYIARADEGMGYRVGRPGRHTVRVTISGKRARAIWHMIGEYASVEDAGDGIFCIRKETADGRS